MPCLKDSHYSAPGDGCMECRPWLASSLKKKRSRKSGFYVAPPNFYIFGLDNVKTGQIKHICKVDLAYESLS